MGRFQTGQVSMPGRREFQRFCEIYETTDGYGSEPAGQDRF